MNHNNLLLKDFKNLKVLVTGTTGFKGAWLAYWLNNLGAKVSGVSLKPEKDSILFKSLNLNKKIKQHYININNFNKINNLVKQIKPDIIFHLAAQSIVSSSYLNPLNTFETNIIGSANILEAYRLNRVPSLLYVTSDKCYLNLDKKVSYRETDELGGLDNYSSSKASAELIFSSYFKSYFNKKKYLSIASVRAGNVIGGGDMKANRILPDIIKSLYSKKKYIILRNPSATRPWQHVLEPLSGYLLIGLKLLKQEIKIDLLPNWNLGPEIINCKNVEYITKLVLDHWGNSNIKIKINKFKNYHESKFLSLNIQKAKNELGWSPRLNLNETIKMTVDWYKFNYNNNKKIESFTDSQIEYFLNK